MSYRHLSRCEREIIAVRRAAGDRLSQIAQLLRRHPATISRELKRNGSASLYDPEEAEQHADSRRCTARHHRRQNYAPLWQQVQQWLARDWSPEIIQAKLQEHYPNDDRMRISPEALYRWIYRNAQVGGHWHHHLWKRRHRRRQRGEYRHLRFKMPGRVSLSNRPEVANQRQRVGDWEGDSVHGRQGKGGLVTHVDRASRFLALGRIADRSANGFRLATVKALSWVPSTLRKTLTLDNGTEMAEHQAIAQTVSGHLLR